MGHGFREVIVDQPFSGKWTEVDMHLGGGHGTFQGTKFSDSAGGFSYRNSSGQPRYAVQNRFIYWRVLNDRLELTESSMDYNLEDNQLRIVFPDSPIVSPISVHETETSVIFLVTTVTSVNRFIFMHPTKVSTEDPKLMKGNKLTSIFQQASVRPPMKLSSFALVEHAVNIPVPTTAASYIMPNNTGYIFALSYESGGVTICKVTKDDTLICYDLRQANLFAKILSYTPSILRSANNTVSPDAVVGLSFFTAKVTHERKDLFLVTLSMNGHLRLYICGNLQTIDSWTILTDLMVDKQFAMAGYTDSTMTLRKFQENTKEYPKFAVFVPGEGFKLFQCLRDGRGPGPAKLILNEINDIKFKEKSLIDFCVTSDFLFTLVSSPDEETEWEVKSYELSEEFGPQFNLTLLEPPPQTEVHADLVDSEPKEYYTDLIFNKCSFSVSTIYSALSMFRNSERFSKSEHDWELTKLYAMKVIDSEIRSMAAESDEPVSDDDIHEANLKYWGEFYTSCVEYHIHTVKPFGIFFEQNSNLPCIVKRSRISFLRPTSFLETSFYFPHLISPIESIGGANQRASFMKFFEIMELLESGMEEFHKCKIARRIRENKQNSLNIWTELASLLTDTDQRSEVLVCLHQEERRHFIDMLTRKLRVLGDEGTQIIKYMIDLLSSWEAETESEEDAQESGDMDTTEEAVRPTPPTRVSQYFMGSRLGANLANRVLKQLLGHRYMLGRNILLLQSLLTQLSGQPELDDEIHMLTALGDQRLAQSTLFRCFSLLAIAERPGEFVYENWSEIGNKVTALLNCRLAEQLVHGKNPDFWPIKLLELFCYSSMGGLAIRSRVNLLKQPSGVLAFVQAMGTAIWPKEDSVDRPFEEFLISAGQFNALAFYATEMEFHHHSNSERTPLSIFYKGLTNLFIGTPQSALGCFLSISTHRLKDSQFFIKLLGTQNRPNLYSNAFYEKAINLFQIVGFPYGVQRLAEKALRDCRDDRTVRIMSVLGFKNALILGDYESAFQFILRMPKESVGGNGEVVVGKERENSIQTFVTRVLENKDVDILVGLKIDSFAEGIRNEIEKVLHAQAKLSDPLTEDSVYQMVYFYHLCRKNFEKAAMVMLERITQIGLKEKGRVALQIQRDSYLDILTCISLRKAAEEEAKAAALARIGGMGSGDSLNVDEWLNELQNINIAATTESLPVEDHSHIRERVKSYETMHRDCELCISILLLKDEKEVGPIKYSLERERAGMCIQSLIQIHHYDRAIKLARMWNLSYLPIVSAFARTCANMLMDLSPGSGDNADYVKYLDVSDLPHSNASVVDTGFLILKKYVTTLEKDKETKLHKEVTTVLLSHSVSIPRWLLDSYKKRDVNQLMLCYMRFGDWEEAAEIALDLLDVVLGRRTSNGYDPSIQVVSPFLATPIIPYTTIEDLANQMNQYIVEKPQLEEVLQNVRERCDDFVLRVLETRRERREMFVR